MKVFAYLILIFLTPAVILSNFQYLVFNSGFYEAEFKKLRVYDNFESINQANQISTNLVSYLCCNEQLDGQFFTEREKLHLVDVQKIIGLVKIHFYLTTGLVTLCILFLLSRKKKAELLFGLQWGSTVAFTTILILWTLAFLNFDKLFLKFHFVAFNNDYWLLPADSNLIRLFPQQFFADFANRIAYQTMVVSTAIFLISIGINSSLLKKHKKNQKFKAKFFNDLNH